MDNNDVLDYVKRLAHLLNEGTTIIASMAVSIKKDAMDKCDDVKLDKLTVTAMRFYKNQKKDQ